jgi:phage terminase large subunit GpA-like protein
VNAYPSAFAAGLMPDRKMTLSEWADDYRMLPSKSSSEPGRWRTSRTPYLRDIMDDLSPHSPIERVVFLKSSQVGGTEVLVNWFGYIASEQGPGGPMMIVQPTIELAERFSKQRIAPMIEETPTLREMISPARTRDSGNSILMKEFRSGVLVIAGSNSATSLRSMPVRFLACDELSAYAKDVGSGSSSEGDPLSLAEKRTQTFSRRKIFLNSTPTTKGECRIEMEYLATDQRKYFVPCPHCDEFQWLKFRQLKWEDDDPNTAKYECEKCGEKIEEWHKTKMLARGEWRATAPSENAKARGYAINTLYSPLGWTSWASVAAEFMKSKKDPQLLRAFVNSILGETFEEELSAKLGADGLKARAEGYELGVAPSGVLALTAGVDVQDNRLAVSLWGWGRDEESWVVLHQEVYGDPARPEVWKQLDEILLRDYRHESGSMIRVSSVCIDTGGHYSHETYQYVRDRRAHPHTRVLAIKGQSQRGKPPIGKPSKQDVNYRGQVLKSGVELYPVGSDTIKSTLFARMKIEKHGSGFVHFSAALNDDFYQQLTSEKQTVRYVKGFPVREWVKHSGARNEALDTAVYAYAALNYLYTRYARATIWNQLESRLGIKKTESVTKDAVEVTTEPSKPEEKPQSDLQNPTNRRNLNVNRRPGGFVTGW